MNMMRIAKVIGSMIAATFVALMLTVIATRAGWLA